MALLDSPTPSAEELQGLLTPEQQGELAFAEMRLATGRFMDVVLGCVAVEPATEQRQTIIDLIQVDTGEVALDDGWKPKEVYRYTSYDPFQILNPELTAATTALVDTTVSVAGSLKPTQEPGLTYLDSRRKRDTIVTAALKQADPGIDDWIDNLPDAERLRPVAHPWSDTVTVIAGDSGEFIEIPNSPALNALTGGAGDGRAVREREAWERDALRTLVDPNNLRDKTLKITSLGTGTGEPAMDTGLSLMQEFYGSEDFTVEVNGFDLNVKSLSVAAHLASQKQAELEIGTLVFKPRLTNLLSYEGIQEAVEGTQADIYEAIGFSEYVASANAPTEYERKQRAKMEKLGCLSAEEFYGAIYEKMPSGSILLTGQMRDDSPQAAFVIDGLGWPNIIQRPTQDYLKILRDAGISGEAVQLFMPDESESAGVYNLVAITKL